MVILRDDEAQLLARQRPPMRLLSLEWFEGAGSHASLRRFPYRPEYDTAQALSISCWFHVAAERDSHTIVSRGDWTMGFSLMVLDVRAPGGNLRGYLGNDYGPLFSSSRVCSNRWHHVVLVAGSGVAKLFLDGVLEAESLRQPGQGGGGVANHVADEERGLWMGGDDQGTGVWVGGEAVGLETSFLDARPRNFFTGRIADLAIVARALEAKDVLATYEIEARQFGTLALTVSAHLEGLRHVCVTGQALAGREFFRVLLDAPSGRLEQVRAIAENAAGLRPDVELVTSSAKLLSKCDDHRLVVDTLFELKVDVL